MPVVYSLIAPAQQWEDANGNPFVGAKLFAYIAGTTTKKTTYTEADGVTPNANPAILNSRGELPSGLWGTTGAYKLVLAPLTDTDPPISPFWTRDNISGVNDLAIGQSEWVVSAVVPVFISATSFSMTGDLTNDLAQNRRLRIIIAGNTLYGTISSSAFAGGATTVVVALDSGALDATISVVSYGLISVNNTSLPQLQSYYPNFRNRIINGDMRIDQRNAGAAITINGVGPFFGPDLWRPAGEAIDGVFTLARSTATPPAGFTHFLRSTVTTADAAIGAAQRYIIQSAIEGINASDLGFGAAGAQAVTLSFRVRSSVAGAFSGSLRNGAGLRAYPFSFTINVINTWETKVITIPGDVTGTWPTDTSLWGTVLFDLGSGVNFRSTANIWNAGNILGVTGAVSLISTLGATFDLTGVQLERGSAATDFERTFFSDMLTRCERYFEKTFNPETAPAQNLGNGNGAIHATCQVLNQRFGSWWMYKTRKRATPTIVTFSPNGASANWSTNGPTPTAAVVGVAEYGAYVAGTTAATASNDYNIHATASAEL